VGERYGKKIFAAKVVSEKWGKKIFGAKIKKKASRH